jgi:3-methylcrotonyl-CoA carboxylase alpha subunit
MRPVDATWTEGRSAKRLKADPTPGGIVLSVDGGAGRPFAVSRDAEGGWVVDGPDGRVRAVVARVGQRVLVSLGGHTFEFSEAASGALAASAAVERDITAPMTGKVVDVTVREGDVVEAGATLVVLEAMKMEHRMKAVAAMRVTSVRVVRGAAVELGALLVTLEPVA